MCISAEEREEINRAEAVRKAGIKDIPVRINTVTKEQGDQLLREAAEARARR